MNVTTSHAIVTQMFFAPDLITASASAELANVMMVGVEMLANAAPRLKLAEHQIHQTVNFVQAMGPVDVVNASAKSKTTSDTRAGIARSAQHVQDSVMN